MMITVHRKWAVTMIRMAVSTLLPLPRRWRHADQCAGVVAYANVVVGVRECVAWVDLVHAVTTHPLLRFQLVTDGVQVALH